MRYFYTDNRPECVQAEQALKKENISFVKIDLTQFRSTDIFPPQLVTEEGRFDGIEGVRYYAEVFSERDKNKD